MYIWRGEREVENVPERTATRRPLYRILMSYPGKPLIYDISNYAATKSEQLSRRESSGGAKTEVQIPLIRFSLVHSYSSSCN